MKAAFQDLMPENHCFGCGPENQHGLRIKSYWDDDQSVCSFQPSAHHAAGPRQFLNGGVTATVIDGHSICTATANAYRLEGREIGSDPQIWCVTGALEVEYLRPIPIDKLVALRARIVEVEGKRTVLECSVSSSDVECARARVVAIRVAPSWREDRSERR